MRPLHAAWRWLVTEWRWPAGALFTGLMLLSLAPLWFAATGAVLGVIYLQLPLYMLHQWEEHQDDRFRRYFNQVLAHGREGLTTAATFWINSLGVWGVDCAALYLAVWCDPELAFVAVYLPVLNALGHIAPAVRRREYNPGLFTAVALFLPVGLTSVVVLHMRLHPGWGPHALGLGLAVAIHAAIIVHVQRRLRQLEC